MAYTFFPESVSQIETKLKFPDKNKEEITRLWSLLNKKYKIKAPINIDDKKPKNVNVVRALEGTANIGQIKREAKLNIIQIRFGNGSLGGRGVKNKGNLFENEFATAIEKYDEGDRVNQTLEQSIAGLYKTYKLSKFKELEAKVEGGRNTPRPFVFGPDIIVKSALQKGNDLGTTVTDITLTDKKDKNKKVYLSLKFGDLTTFFNSGVRTILTPAEIKAYKIKNQNGNRLLKMFGIDKRLFADVFNGKLKKGVIKNVWPTMDAKSKRALEILIQSGIGFGYHVIHKLKTGRILSFKVDERYMKEASKPSSLTLYYGGKTGTGKRINMEVFTPKYKLTLNIRDTQGNDGYPTRMMCDFSYR